MKNKVFIYIFFCICLVPLLTMGISDSSDQVANQILTEVPKLVDEAGKININYLSEFSNFFDDHIGLRNHLITAEHRITAAIFGESSEEKVILGKDGWLFYKETLEDFQITNPLTDRELYVIETNLSLIQEYFSNNGINFAFTVVPNKNSLYGDKMPYYYKHGTGDSNLDVFSKTLNNSNVNYIDLYSVFKNTDKVLYRKTDSHWTNEGAGLASDAILKAVGKDATEYYGTETEVVTAQTGDLYEMIYPSGEDKDIDVVYQHDFSFEYTKPIRSVEDNFIRTACEGKSGSLYTFRDSFGNTLYPYLADNFANATFTRLIPYNLTLPVAEGADTVLIEIVERNLRWLYTKAPVFPAPERNISNFKDATENAVISFSETSEIDGYIKIEGRLDKIDNYNDNIYIKTNTKIYEATLTGQDTFVAYIPISEKTDNFKVLTGILLRRN